MKPCNTMTSPTGRAEVGKPVVRQARRMDSVFASIHRLDATMNLAWRGKEAGR